MLSVIVPCYNEEEVILKTVKRLKDVAASFNTAYELLFVNDGSSDKTLALLKKEAEKDSHIKVISLSRNWGHQPAVSAGIHCCQGAVCAIIDADLQDPPEVLPQMVDLMERERCNVVYGVREVRRGETLFKRLTAALYYRILNMVSDVPIPVDTGDFRVIDKKVIDTYKRLPEKEKYIRGLISWMGFKQLPFYYKRAEREEGYTKYTFSKMVSLAAKGLFSFSRKPLRIAFFGGALSLFTGLVLAVWVFILFFFFPEKLIPGWASITIIIIFMGGAQLLFLGTIGEYIGSIFDQVKGRPEFLIDETVNLNRD